MKRVAAIALSAGALAAAALWAVAGAGAENGPACRDIEGETHSYAYDANAGTGTINLRLLFRADASACKQVTYTLAVSGVSGNPVVVSQQGSGDFVGVGFSDTDAKICISATTAAGGRTGDLAPDFGCLEITPDSSGGKSGFN